MKKLIKNPLFRIIGIGIILYYGLFNNKYDADSLGNRLSPEKLKGTLSEVSSKTVFIINGVQKAQEAQDKTKDLDTNKKPTQNDQ